MGFTLLKKICGFWFSTAASLPDLAHGEPNPSWPGHAGDLGYLGYLGCGVMVSWKRSGL